MAGITLLVFALVTILSYAQISSQRKILEMKLNERIALMRTNLIEREKSFIINLSQQIENDLAVLNDRYVLRLCVGQTLTEERHVCQAWQQIQKTAAKLE